MRATADHPAAMREPIALVTPSSTDRHQPSILPNGWRRKTSTLRISMPSQRCPW